MTLTREQVVQFKKYIDAHLDKLIGTYTHDDATQEQESAYFFWLGNDPSSLCIEEQTAKAFTLRQEAGH